MCVSLQDIGGGVFWPIFLRLEGLPNWESTYLITAMPVNILAFFNMYRTHAKTEVAIIVLALTWYWSNA